MIELIADGDVGYDCTSNYDIAMKNICTVSQFVANVTKRDDSNNGVIYVINHHNDILLCKFNYRDNQMEYDTDSEQNWKDISRNRVLKAMANGGYGRMTYYIYINL